MTLSDGEKAAQLVFPGFKFGVDDPAEAASWVELGVGGFCLYGGQAREVADFTAALQKKAKIPLLFCADYEEGVASQSVGGTRLPTNMALGAAGSEALAFEKGALTALEARALGVRWVFAPVLDLATQPQNPIVNVRAFSSDPAEVSRLAGAYLEGLSSQGALGCLKHFPGHGETLQDSHLELPHLGLSRETLWNRELRPFLDLAPRAGAVMTGHLVVPALEPDEKTPVSLSEHAVGFLRRELKFDGLVSTDALAMHAVSRHFPEIEAAERALLAGSDVLLVPAAPRKLIFSVLSWGEEGGVMGGRIAEAWARLERAKEALGLFKPGGLERPDIACVGSPEHGRAAAAMAEKCLAWVAGAFGPLSGEVGYLEPDASDPAEFVGAPFLAALRELGVSVTPYEGGRCETLIVGSFLSPQAYAGRIRFEPELIARAKAAAGKAGKTVLAAFGSPFAAEDFPGCPALCAFSVDEHAQRAAARALAGKIPVTGRVPLGQYSK